MATLSIGVASLSAVKNALDANATRVFQAVLKRHGFVIEGMTAQEQLNEILGIIVNFLLSSATAQEANDATEAARLATLGDAPTLAE